MVGDLSDVQASGTLRFKPLGHTEQLHESWGWELSLHCVPPLTCSGANEMGNKVLRDTMCIAHAHNYRRVHSRVVLILRRWLLGWPSCHAVM